MILLRDLWRCLRSQHYGNHNHAIAAQRIARMYGNCSRMENCRFCGGFTVEFRKDRP